MPRARNIKPGFFMNEELAECDLAARLLFIGLWCIADREGRLKDRPKRIGAFVFPYEHYDIDDLLNQLHAHGFITRYEVDNERYIQIVNFKKHQRPHPREAESEIPAPGIITQEIPTSGIVMQEYEVDNRIPVPGIVTWEHEIVDDNRDYTSREKVCTSREKVCTSREKVCTSREKVMSSPSDILNPDILNPDILNPDILNRASKVDAHAISLEGQKVGQDLDLHAANGVSDTGVEADKVTVVSGHNPAGKSSEQLRNPFKSMTQQRRFDSFWAMYPKKRSKGQAEKAWVKINPDEELFRAIMRGLELAKGSVDWAKDNGQFIPYPSTWLNAKGWEDEYVPAIRGQRVNRRDMPFEEYMTDVCGEGWEDSVKLPWLKTKNGGGAS